MADQNSQYMAMLTAVGEAKLANATALGVNLNITQLGVGDANGAEPMPSRTQTALINERRRAPLNQLSIDPNNSAIIIAEQVIPEDVGGWWIREIGLYDEAGDLVAVSNCPPTYKPELAQGSGRTQVVRLNILVSSTQSIQLKVDPSVVLATRGFAESLIVGHLAATDPHPQYTTEAEVAALIAAEMNSRDSKQSVRFTTTANIILSGLTVQAGGDWSVALSAGDRVLVKDQNNGALNGIYAVAAGSWNRAVDADASLEVTPGMLVPVEQGTVNADSIWHLVTDSPISLGTTPLTFEIVAGPTGTAAGSYRSVTVDKRGRVIGGTNPTTLEGYGITNALRVNEPSSQRPALTGSAAAAADDVQGAAMEIREVGLVASGNTDDSWSPRIAFHWSNVVVKTLAMTALGNLMWGGKRVALVEDIPVSTDGLAGAASALKASASGTNATVNVSADAICVKDSAGRQKVLGPVALAINSAAVGVNGLDTGALAASTWYSVWVIWNSNTTAGLLSLSTTAPTLPAGYTHKARVGWIRTDATANKFPLGFIQAGRRVQYRVAAGSNVPSLPVMASGVQGNPTHPPAFVAVGTAAVVPPTAGLVSLSLFGYIANTSVIAAPNASHYGVTSTAGLASPLHISQGSPTGATHAAVTGDMTLESSNIYYASSAPAAGVACLGWEDNL